MDTKIIQITAGRGPIECTWVVAKVLKFFLNEIADCEINCKVLHKLNGSENGTVQSVTLHLSGCNLSTVDSWIGTIQYVGQSQFRKFHKRKNWFIGIYESEVNKATDFDLNEVSFQAIRSSGPGGQHVNKVSSAIRATHHLTNTQVLVMESRSQHQNKKIAIERLKLKVLEKNQEKLCESIQNQWSNHLSIERGNPVKTFYGTDFKQRKVNKTFKNKRNALKRDLRKQLE